MKGREEMQIIPEKCFSLLTQQNKNTAVNKAFALTPTSVVVYPPPTLQSKPTP